MADMMVSDLDILNTNITGANSMLNRNMQAMQERLLPSLR